MIVLVLMACLAAGIICGFFIIPEGFLQNIDTVTTAALVILVFSVGIDIGCNKEIFKKIKQHGFKVLLIPLGIIAGSLAFGIGAGYLIGEPAKTSAALSSGLGWYSLTAILLKDIAGAQVATTAFLTNIFREVLTFLLLPLLAKIDFKTTIAPAGATAMDTTLPLIRRYTDEETALLAVISGLVCTTAVPFMVPLIYAIF